MFLAAGEDASETKHIYRTTECTAYELPEVSAKIPVPVSS